MPLEYPGAHYILELKTPSEVYKYQDQLCTILQECVNKGSSIGFLAPLSSKDALDYWLGASELITKGNLHLFILTSATSSTEHTPVLGTVQLSLIPKATHLHRAEVIKLMVLPSARRLGIARDLMLHVEAFAKGIERSMLTLDTATESAAMEMYRRLEWEEWGTCKVYASWPDGRRCDATFFRKDI